MTRAKKRLTNTKKVKPLVEKERALLRDKIEVGDFFQLINLFVIFLVIYLLIMGGIEVIDIFREAQFIIIALVV